MKNIFSLIFNGNFESGRFIHGLLNPIFSQIVNNRLEYKQNLIQINGYSRMDELKKSFTISSINQWTETIYNFSKNNDFKIIYFLSPLDKKELNYFDKIREKLINKNFKFIFCKERYLEFNGLNFSRNYWSNLANPHGGNEYHIQYYKCFDEKYEKL